MGFEVFRGSDRPSLGVELAFQLVDARTLALSPAIDDVLRAIPEAARDAFKPEFHRSCVEIHALPAREVVRGLVERLRGVAEGLGCASHLGHVARMAEGPTGVRSPGRGTPGGVVPCAGSPRISGRPCGSHPCCTTPPMG